MISMARQVAQGYIVGIIQDYNHGSLKMYDYPNVVTSLKATWIKGRINTETN